MEATEPIVRAAVVTGSSRGIGRAIARELAAHGMHVVVNCSRPEGLEAAEAVAAEIKADFGVDAVAVAANVALGRVDFELADAAAE